MERTHKTKLTEVLRTIYQSMNRGSYYTEILDELFITLGPVIPFDRIGIALIDDDSKTIKLKWVKSKAPILSLDQEYTAELATSSLAEIIRTGNPRIINDLEKYYQAHPNSTSSERILRDGIRSSLTCPLIANGHPIGVIFFSSTETLTYNEVHVDTFSEIAESLSLIIGQELLKKALFDQEKKEREFRNAIHDLSTPLTVIKGTLALIEKKNWFHYLDEKHKKSFEMLKKSGSSMVKIIDTVIYGKDEVVPKLVPEIVLEDFLNDIRQDCKILGNEKKITIEVRKTADVPKLLHFNSYVMKEALQNLISNAIKFSPIGSHVMVMASYAEKAAGLTFEVSDNGPGIPYEEQKNLFKPFGLTSVKPTAGENSSGHGLSSVKDLIEGLSGNVYMKSSVGVGSTFGISIPT